MTPKLAPAEIGFGYPVLKVTVEAGGDFFIRDRLEQRLEQRLAVNLKKQRPIVLSDWNVARLGEPSGNSRIETLTVPSSSRVRSSRMTGV